MLLYLLSWVSTILHLFLGTICLGAGMYYLADVIEEFTVLAKKVITFILWTVTGILVGLLLLEGFPLLAIGSGLGSHLCFFVLLRTFPFMSLTSPAFIGSCVFIVAHHYFTLQHFSEVWYPFSEVMAYATICLWLLPFAFFISLSANDNVLPLTSPISTPHSSTSDAADSDHVFGLSRNKSHRYGFRALVDAAHSYFPSKGKKF